MGRRKDKLELNDGSFFLFELNVKTNRANKYLAFCSIGIVIYMTKLLHHDWPRGVQSIQSNGLLKDLGEIWKKKNKSADVNLTPSVCPLKCLSGVWGFYIFEIFGYSWEKLQHILSAEKFIFIYFFAVRVDGCDVKPGICLYENHCTDSWVDVTSVNFNGKKVLEDKIFGWQDILQFFRILLLGWDIKVCLICTQHLAYVILHNELL